MNTQINITKNGTTTLATASKYCDRNIDVNVEVPSYEAELAEQKAITDSILDREITEYVNDTAINFGLYAFAYCRSLTKIRCDAVRILRNYSLRDCSVLTEARFDSLTTIATQVFLNCTALEKLILGSSTLCELTNANAFQSSAIANGTGYVYVPDDLVDSYKKTATNWVTYANQIKGISELGG